MKVYTLTPMGERLARSINSPSAPTWRIIHFLDKNKQATDEAIKAKAGVTEQEYPVAMAKLQKAKPRVITVVGGIDGI